MKNRIICGAVGSLLLLAGAFVLRAKDPTVMTVNGREVPLSEFEYLYLKNQVQTQLQPLEEYAEIFKLYQLKVADALTLGIDTTKAFRDEYQQYRSELAQPYLTDSAYIKSLVDEAYGYYEQQVHPYHIMLMKTPNGVENRMLVNRLDSIRQLILDGKVSFEEMASQYSDDRGSRNNGGDLGWTNNPNLPYAFLKTVYTLEPGVLSEIVETPVGFHLIKITGRRPNQGYLSASHLMKRVAPDTPPEEEASIKALIDSIYNVVTSDPDKFEELVVRFTDDNDSRKRGGRLQPFPQGALPQPFDSIAFAMNDNEISAPLRTPYGWHIIRRFSMRPLESAEKMNNQLTAIINNPRDIRYEMLNNRQLEQLCKEFKLKPVKKNLTKIRNYIDANGLDTLAYENMCRLIGDAPLFTFKGGTLTLKDLQPQLVKLENRDPAFAHQEMRRRINVALRHKLLPLKEQVLEATNTDYRNLLHEFRDGSLLYEAGRIQVWDRAANDTEGLNKYFKEHKSEYTWQQPRAKGFLVQVVNDSVAELVKNRMSQLTPENYLEVLRNEFGDKIQIDHILAQKGTNPIIDHLAFGGNQVETTNPRFSTVFLMDLKIIDAPEEMLDVKGLVVADYQNYLMQMWEEQLKKKYPISVNSKVLNQVRIK